MFLLKLWSRCIVPNVSIFTIPNRQGIITSMERTSEPDSLICFSWFGPSTVQNDPQISLYPGKLAIQPLDFFHSTLVDTFEMHCPIVSSLPDSMDSRYIP